MKTIILSIGGILIAVNLLFGMLLSVYGSFNMWFNTIVIAATTIMLYLVQTLSLKDAFRISLTVLLPITGCIKLLLGLVSPEHVEDNWCVICCVVITICEVVMLMAVHKVSHLSLKAGNAT